MQSYRFLPAIACQAVLWWWVARVGSVPYVIVLAEEDMCFTVIVTVVLDDLTVAPQSSVGIVSGHAAQTGMMGMMNHDVNQLPHCRQTS
jgi:hypothetical protein